MSHISTHVDEYYLPGKNAYRVTKLPGSYIPNISFAPPEKMAVDAHDAQLYIWCLQVSTEETIYL